MSVRHSLFVLAILVAMPLTTVACTSATASPSQPPAVDSGSPLPEQPGGSGDSAGNIGDPSAPIGAQPPEDPGQGDGALHVQPAPGIVDALPHAWDRITIAADGRTITVYYWGGVEDCYGLAGVDVQLDADGRPVIQVLEGRRGNLPPDTACIEIALLKAVTVELEEPIVAPLQ